MTELPSSWITCPIGEVLLSVEMTAKDEPDRDIWYVDISSIDNQSNKIVDPKRIALSAAPSRARQKIISGDTLFSTVRPYLRKIAAVPEKYDGEIASTGFAVLRPAEGIHHRYIFYKAVSHDFVSALTGEQYGVSYPAVKEEQVRSQELQLPPTNEQRRIVERIEAMFDEIDHGVENLKKARATLGLYRQSLLKSAFEGRLTADWRARNADQLEPPEALLARIQAERDTRYKSALDDWQKALTDWRENGEKGKKPSKPKRGNASTTYPMNAIIQVEQLPADWGVAKLVEVIDIVSGGTPKGVEDCTGSDIPFFKVSDMNSPGNEETVRSAQIRASYEEIARLGLSVFPEGTIIFPKRGGAILTNKKRKLGQYSSFDLNTMGLVNQTDTISNDFLWFWMLSVNLGDIYDGSNVPQINNKNVEPLSFPICSAGEQAEITRILDERLSAADALEAEIDAGLTRAEALRQSILKQAFSGKLVPQNPEDEPAATLLARIKAEKAAKPKATRKRKATA